MVGLVSLGLSRWGAVLAIGIQAAVAARRTVASKGMNVGLSLEGGGVLRFVRGGGVRTFGGGVTDGADFPMYQFPFAIDPREVDFSLSHVYFGDLSGHINVDN